MGTLRAPKDCSGSYLLIAQSAMGSDSAWPQSATNAAARIRSYTCRHDRLRIEKTSGCASCCCGITAV